MANRLDYYNTLLATEAGRRVWYEIRKTARLWFRDGTRPTAEEMYAQCVLDSFLLFIETKCGISTPEAEMKMLSYMAAVAAARLEEKGPEKKDVNLHETS